MTSLFDLFGQVNSAIWPMLVIWYGLAGVAVVLAVRPVGRSDRLISAGLAAYYLWVAAVFFAINFGQLNSHAPWYAAWFALGGGLFFFAGVVHGDLAFRPHRDASSVVGGLFIAYALVVYPILGAISGHPYPATPVFGVAPCPTTIFTFGLLLWARPPVPRYLLVVPLVWSLTAVTGAVGMGVTQDIGMAVAAVVGSAWIGWRDRSSLADAMWWALALGAMLLLAGHDDLLIGIGLVVLIVPIARGFWRHRGGTTPMLRRGGSPA